MKRQTTLIILWTLCLFSVLSSQTQINSNSSDLQLFPKVAYTEGGRFLFTWVSNHQYQDKDFEIISRSADASTLSPYGSDEPLSASLTARSGHRLHAEIVPSIEAEENDTGAMVAWIDHKEQKVYTMRISHAGYAYWDKPVDVHPANPNYVYTPPEMCSDGAGGAYFVWVDGKIFDKMLINDIIVSAVLKVYNRHQLNPFVGFRRTT